ncbi:MAG: hypothetical protein R3C59_15905, partial [Planctomycetaceae bacterium]
MYLFHPPERILSSQMAVNGDGFRISVADPPELSVSLSNTLRLFNATFSHGSPLRDHEIAAQVNRTIVLATADRYVEATHENTP